MTGQHVVLVRVTNRHENKQIKNSFWSLLQLMRVYRGFVFEVVAHLPALRLLTRWTINFALVGVTRVAFIINLKWCFMVFNFHTSMPHQFSVTFSHSKPCAELSHQIVGLTARSTLIIELQKGLSQATVIMCLFKYT